jgi:hypothetical protein
MTGREAQPNYLPPIDTVATAYEEVLTHNDRHGSGSGYRNIVSALLEMVDESDVIEDEPRPASGTPAAPQEQPAPSSFDASIDAAVAAGDMEGEVQGIIQEDIFTRIGVQLAPEGKRIVGGNAKRATSTELIPTIENTELFSDFLGTLTPDTVQNGHGRKLLDDVARILRKNVELFHGEMPPEVSAEELDAMRQHGDNLLRSFSRVEEAYSQLGIDTKDTQALSTYVTYWGRGLLREYLRIGPLEQLASHKLECVDSELATKGWQAKIEYIKFLLVDDKTREFGMEAAEALQAGFVGTINLMDQNPDEWYATAEDRTMIAGLLSQLGCEVPQPPERPPRANEQYTDSGGDPLLDALARVMRTLNEQ